MKRIFHSIPRLAFAIAALATILAAPVQAQNGNQSVTLSAGWNSVWLEIEPLYAVGDTKRKNPAVADGPTNVDVVLTAGHALIGTPKSPWDVFSNAAVEIIATPKPLSGIAEFFATDPITIGTFNQEEWQQWKRLDESASNNLFSVFGNRPYLVKVANATAQFTLNLAGKARFFRPIWIADRYNLLGFGMDGTPTFDAFFAASAGRHDVAKIFRLNVNGTWEHVPLVGAPMAPGQAYWIFSKGPSNYMGPVAVDFDNAVTGTLSFGGPSDAVAVGTGVDALDLDLEELVFSNLGTTAAIPGLDLRSASAGQGSLALHVVRPATNSLGYLRGSQVDSSVGAGAGAALGETIATKTTATLTLGAKRNWAIGSPDRTNLYRLTTGAGSAFWLPVTAINSSIQLPTDLTANNPLSATNGLWVGEVIINAATSIVEDGAPTRPSAGSAPIRILLHSSGAGSVRLLSQVTVMQTKTADPTVPATPVLVVDAAKIPFFEGIKERNGKRVGVRVEAVAYDMPRKLDAASQNALLQDPAYPGLIEAGLSGFLVSRATRPPSLAEVYHLSWAMSGAVGAGKTVSTSASAPLTLDPFHRSNPFRHAFHQNLPKGPNITRAFEIVFDADQSIPDRLRGTFRETIQGLMKSNLELTGRVEFRRVSPVDTLQ